MGTMKRLYQARARQSGRQERWPPTAHALPSLGDLEAIDHADMLPLADRRAARAYAGDAAVAEDSHIGRIEPVEGLTNRPCR